MRGLDIRRVRTHHQDTAQNFRFMSKKHRKKPRSPGKLLWFKQDPRDPRQIILKNGTRLRQPIVGLGLYMSQGMSVYGISRKGLRKLHINFWKKNTYGKNTQTGTTQGQNYPYINFEAAFIVSIN